MNYFRLIILLVSLGFVPKSTIQAQLHLPWEEVLGPSVAIKAAVNSSDGVFGISNQDLFHWNAELDVWERMEGPALSGRKFYSSIKSFQSELYITATSLVSQGMIHSSHYKGIAFEDDWQETNLIRTPKVYIGGINGEFERWYDAQINYSNLGTYTSVSYSDDFGENYTVIDTLFSGNNPYLNYTYDGLYWLEGRKLKFLSLPDENQIVVDLDFEIGAFYIFEDRWLAFEDQGNAPYNAFLLSTDQGETWESIPIADPLTPGTISFFNNQYYYQSSFELRKFDSDFQEIFNYPGLSNLDFRFFHFVSQDLEMYILEDDATVYSVDQGQSYQQKYFRNGKVYIDKIIPWGDDLRIEKTGGGLQSIKRSRSGYHIDTSKNELYSIVSDGVTVEYKSSISKYKFQDTEFGWENSQLLSRSGPNQAWEEVINIAGLHSMFFLNNRLWALGQLYAYSDDLGQTWYFLESPKEGRVQDLFVQDDFLFVSIATDPENEAKGIEIYRYHFTDLEWLGLNEFIDCTEVVKLVQTENRLLALCDHEIYSSSDDGQEWVVEDSFSWPPSPNDFPDYFTYDGDYFLDQKGWNCSISNQQFENQKNLVTPTKNIGSDGWVTLFAEGARTFLFHEDYLYAGGQGLWRVSKAAIDAGIEPTANIFEICEESSLVLNGIEYSEAGDHVYYNQNGALESFSLIVNPIYETTVNEFVDYGVIVNGQPLYSDTIFTTNLLSESGCDSIANIRYVVDESTRTNELTSENLFSIHPNPTAGNFYIKGDLSVKEVNLMDLNGRLLKQNLTVNLFSIADFENGIYFVEIVHDEGVEVLRILKI